MFVFLSGCRKKRSGESKDPANKGWKEQDGWERLAMFNR